MNFGLTLFFNGPSLLNGHPDADAVLRELLDDPSPKIRRLARIGLKLEPFELPPEKE